MKAKKKSDRDASMHRFFVATNANVRAFLPNEKGWSLLAIQNLFVCEFLLPLVCN